MEKNNPFSPLQTRADRYLKNEMASQQWESARVEWTIKQLKLQDDVKELKARSAFADRVFFSTFNEWFASFPFHIVAEPMIDKTPIDADPHSVHPRWFASFLDLPFVRMYEDYYVQQQASDDKRPLAMVFPRRGLAQGFVLHNGGMQFVPTMSSAHLFLAGPPSELCLCVQPYAKLIEHIQTNIPWR